MKCGVVTRRDFVRAARRVQRQGGKVVFTNGVFDLLHYGHVVYLEKARALGDRLFVAVNSDRSVRRLKGKGRPLCSQRHRLRMLAALRCVDYVTLFAGATPKALIADVQPDILVKGADYGWHQIVGAEQVKAQGGQVVRMPLLKGRSTSALIAKIRGRS